MGRDREFPLSPQVLVNLTTLVTALNYFGAAYGKKLKVTSGYRPSKYNAGFAPGSTHLRCEGVDFADADGTLAAFCLSNTALLEKCGLYLENPKYTSENGHVHLQIRAPKSGKRVFDP